ncbi:MAG: response regulator [Amaricoccus sp.]
MSVLDPAFESGRLAVTPRDMPMLAHDLRGALQGITGGIALIDTVRCDPLTRDQLNRVSAAAEMVTFLVASLLDDSGGAEPDPVRIDGLLDYLRRRWQGEAKQCGVELRLAVASGAPAAVRVDPVMLRRIIGNLVCNSLRHGASSVVELLVEPAAGGGISFRLRDDGRGLDPEMLVRLRSPVDRAAIAPQTQHGLGLHIVRELSSRLGGEGRFDNRVSGGLEAVIGFPAELCIGASPAASAAVENGRPDLSGVRILLAEDNPTNQMVAIQMLSALRAEVTIASDGIEALERYETGAYDLVVVDIEMPRMSGLDVIRTIRSRGDGRARVPIVALTAYALREHQDRIAEAGANGLISKPISSIEALGRALAGFVQPARGHEPDATAVDAGGGEAGPVVDLATYEALRQAIGADMMAELIEKVVVDLVSAQGELAAALEPLDRGPIRSASHILISVAGAIGARRLENCARELNRCAHGADDAAIAAELRRCLDELALAIAFARGQLAGG